MRITAAQILLMAFTMSLSLAREGFSQEVLNREVTLDLSSTALKDALKAIEDQVGVKFVYSSTAVELTEPVTINASKEKLSLLLDKLLRPLSIDYIVKGKVHIVLRPSRNTGETAIRIIPENPGDATSFFDVTGRVTDASTNEPLPGVNIIVKNTTIGTTTDSDGFYRLSITEGNRAVLVFSFIGYETREIEVTEQTVINVAMDADIRTLSEVVVVGYGTQKKENLTGAVDVISREALDSRPSGNVGSLLQGVSPNLNISITGFGGEPGAPNNFNIRGVGSLTGGAPLILVDGVEMNINNLDPESIESVSILKDAASAAIYGSRAPFGVVLITTKKGTKDRGISVTYSNFISSSSPMSLPKWQSSLRYVTAYNQALENSGLPPKFGPAQIDRIKRYMEGTYLPEYDTVNPPNSIWAGRHEGNANYEWWDEYFKDHTINQKHNINISGGDDKTQYFLSTGFFDQGSSYNWADEYYRRYNVLANISSQPNSWLRFNVSTKYANTKSAHPNAGSDWDPGRTFVISEMIKFFPTTTFYNVNGTVNNPYVNVLMHVGPATSNENDLFLGLGTEIEPVKGWKTNFTYNYNNNSSKNTWLDNEIWVELPDGQTVNFWNDPNSYTEDWGFNNYSSLYGYTSYEKAFSNHNVKAMVGYEREYRSISSIYGRRTNLISEEVPAFSASTGTFNLGDAKSHWATEAFFGRLNYDYRGKYLLEVNGRYNGSSRFAKESRWGFFPSFSVGYNISHEPFWESLKSYIADLKIRGSYGSLGNQNVPNYLYLSNVPVSTNQEWIIDNERPNYANIPAIISPSLTWETVNTVNFGVDAYFLNNRLGVVYDWFVRRTQDMFGPAQILPNSLGTTPPQENNASLETKGWELSVEWKDRIKSELDYSARLILADSRTKVTEYLNLTGQIDQFYAGKDLGEIWGYVTDGIIQSENEQMPDQSFLFNRWGPGDIKYTDLNGDDRINDGNRTLDNHGDLKVIGNSLPRYSIGFSGSVAWKNFDLGIFLQGVLRRDLFPTGNMQWGVGTRGDNGGAFYQGHDDYWRPATEDNLFGPNTDAFYPKPYITTETSKNQRVQTRFLLNAKYVRLKNIQLGYNVPRAIIERVKLQSLRIYVSGENLLTFDKLPPYLDPETAFANSSFLGAVYPLSKSISAGLNITF